MRLYSKGSIITIGTFDGVHRGHQRIFRALVNRARVRGYAPIVLAFTFPPKHYVRPRQEPLQLTVWKEKKRLIQSFGIKKVVPVRFSRSLSTRSPAEFLHDIIRTYTVKEIIVGFNFAFGKDRKGNTSFLKKKAKKYGVRVWIKRPVCVRGARVSSSLIRSCMQKGDIAATRTLLGYPYKISGTVVPGAGWAREQGIPTANVHTSRYKLLPGGVYTVAVQIGRYYFPGLSNCGFRPTLHPVKTRLLEVHILHQHINLYGRHISVYLLKRLRPERVYKHQEALVEQIYRDRANAERYFRKNPIKNIVNNIV
jgi:riboflavin kinase/FMN adenylyltransferase